MMDKVIQAVSGLAGGVLLIGCTNVSISQSQPPPSKGIDGYLEKLEARAHLPQQSFQDRVELGYVFSNAIISTQNNWSYISEYVNCALISSHSNGLFPVDPQGPNAVILRYAKWWELRKGMLTFLVLQDEAISLQFKLAALKQEHEELLYQDEQPLRRQKIEAEVDQIIEKLGKAGLGIPYDKTSRHFDLDPGHLPRTSPEVSLLWALQYYQLLTGKDWLIDPQFPEPIAVAGTPSPH